MVNAPMSPLSWGTPVTNPFGPSSKEATDLAEDARRLLAELDREVPGAAALNAECRPPIDVLETQTAVEIVVDVPGVRPDSLRVAIRRNTLLVVGVKTAPGADPTMRYHLAERSYGRFARAVRLAGAVDPNRASARAAGGELRIVLPYLTDRRGSVLTIPVDF
jgi:HSP20 family protein